MCDLQRVYGMAVCVCLFLILRQSFCIHGWPGTGNVDQGALELREVYLPLPQSAGMKGKPHSSQLAHSVFLAAPPLIGIAFSFTVLGSTV